MGHKLQINQNNIDQWQTDEDKITIIEKEDDINQIRKFKKEAIKTNNSYIQKICFSRIIKLKSLEEQDPFIRKFKEALYAYEEKLYEKNNKNVRASRLRDVFDIKKLHNPFIKSIIKKGIYKLVTKERQSDGFAALQSKNMKQYTLEYLVIEFSEEFPDELVEFCKVKLDS